ncbi:TetR/AcrR family transcriptional regulator C-terminal domain-containing protein [Nocardia sp. CA2R105]|uniref:TetR/AcrR family transcriptional regulator C-terminal domain-containing protein n=1 Tax=Nocardia coffeae TaxID=2873381 RepID=UPI001CA7346C|nr:TetR/AcrR family transcriptional regulator C-terminal domain-containing protein [Nocardia coffeae]MBY8861637.1 TetR/AcrR family transcriptional regulator C-terminal domain-containing protein [Nocardia coffeae]
MALNRQRVVEEAVALLDENGLDGVSLRKLAQRLGVQAPTLYWHIRNKAALITALAEAILTEEFADLRPPDPAEPWQRWLTELATRLRRALLAHPDGARVISAAQLSTRMNRISEVAMKTLVDQDIPLREARLRVLAVERFTVGHVLEEQSPRPDEDALRDFDADAFAAQHPTVIAGISEYFQDGRTVDDLFQDTLRLIIE